MHVKFILVIAVLTAFAGSAVCHEPVLVDINEYPWSSIGKLYNRAGGACTAAVISRTEVATAAHCLYNPRTGAFLQAGSLHFLVGYKQGEYRDDLRVSKFISGPNYKPDKTASSETGDWAILTLELPVAEEIKPLPLTDSPASIGNRIMVGGFAQSRRFELTADTDCRIRAILPNGLLVHDCIVMKGDSGAPLIRSNGDAMEVIGVHVGSGQINGVAVQLAVPASNFDRTLR